VNQYIAEILLCRESLYPPSITVNALRNNYVRGKMKNIKFITLAILILTSLPAYSGELDKAYSPTRKEWLELSLTKTIKDRTDVWKQRIGSVIWVKEEENTIFITLSSANGQEELKVEAQKNYLDTIKKDVENFKNKYSWAKKLKVRVQFI